MRIDLVSEDELSDAVTERMQAYISEALPQVDAIILSDYENGVISPAIVGTVLTAGSPFEEDCRRRFSWRSRVLQRCERRDSYRAGGGEKTSR